MRYGSTTSQNAPAKRGPATRGRITQLSRGRSCGVIRTRQGRNIFFHAGDLEGVKFQDLACGESVTFELIEDSVSGPRAVFIRTAATRARRARVPDGTTV